MDLNVATRTILYLSMIALALAALYVVLAYNRSVAPEPDEPDVTVPTPGI